MKIKRALIPLMVFLLFGCISQPALAQEGDNGLNKECASFCTENGFEDGHYLAPEPDAHCNDGYTKNPDNEICCCKKKE